MAIDLYIEDVYSYDTSKILRYGMILVNVIQNPHSLTVIKRAQGTYNNVYIYTNGIQKFAIRVGKKPIIMSYFHYKDEIINSKKNWKLASDNNISPRVLYNGYYRDVKDNLIYDLIIMEAYDMDVRSYYKLKTVTDVHTLDEDDITIELNIRKKLYSLASNNMWMECIDIKPLNMVINTDTLDVRLIDMDGDFCTFIDTQQQNIGTTIEIYIEGCILMAVHFYNHGNNIMFKYMQSFPKQDLFELVRTRLQTYPRLFRNVQHYFQNIFEEIYDANTVGTDKFHNADIWAYILVECSRLRVPDFIYRYTSNHLTFVEPNDIKHVDCKDNEFHDPTSHGCINKKDFQKHILGNDAQAQSPKKKRCPKGSRKNKEGTCVKSDNNRKSSKSTVKQKRCPNGSRKNKEGKCIQRIKQG